MLVQGLILMAAGMTLVVTFLSLLVGVMAVSAKIVPRFNHLLPEEAPRVKARAPGARAGRGDGRASEEEEVAAAIAAVWARQRGS